MQLLKNISKIELDYLTSQLTAKALTVGTLIGFFCWSEKSVKN